MDNEKTNAYEIVCEPAEDGGFIATIPEVPGAISEGATEEIAREMVLDALAELLAARQEMAGEDSGQN